MTVASGCVDDIGGVEPAAEADLEQKIVGGVSREGEKRGGGGDLEQGDRLAGIGRLAFVKQLDELVLVDELPPPAGRAGCARGT